MMEANEVNYVHHKMDQDGIRNKSLMTFYSVSDHYGCFYSFLFILVMKAYYFNYVHHKMTKMV